MGSIPVAGAKKKEDSKCYPLSFHIQDTGIEKEGAQRKKTVRWTVFADEGVIGAMVMTLAHRFLE